MLKNKPEINIASYTKTFFILHANGGDHMVSQYWYWRGENFNHEDLSLLRVKMSKK